MWLFHVLSQSTIFKLLAAQMPEYETILPSLYLPGPYATYDYTHLPPALKASDQLPCGQRVSNLSVRKW